jgi:membrane-associated phospholipid phosphatase
MSGTSLAKRLLTPPLLVRRALFGVGTTAALQMATVGLARAAPAGTVKLDYDLTRDVALTAGSVAMAASLELLMPVLAPKNCRWCDRDAQGNDTLNAFDAAARRALRWSNPGLARKASNVFSYGLAPLVGIGVGGLVAWGDGHSGNMPVDALIIAEASMLAVNLNQIIKFAFGRERPDVHARTPEERAALASNGDNLSFYSGHTTFAFALATSAGTVTSMRHYRLAPVIWVTGMTLAATSGYFRIAADRHYASDVLTGALVGSLVGFAVPYFGHRPLVERGDITVTPVTTGNGIGFSATW